MIKRQIPKSTQYGLAASGLTAVPNPVQPVLTHGFIPQKMRIVVAGRKMAVTTWNRKQVLTTVALAVLIAVVIVQAYSLAVLLPARAGSNSVNGVSTTTGTANTITVSGTGHSSVKPDTAIVTIGVLSQGATVQAAVQDNGNTMSQVVSALNNIGIDNSNLQTTYYNVSPLYSTNQPPMITGYQVMNQVQ